MLFQGCLINVITFIILSILLTPSTQSVLPHSPSCNHLHYDKTSSKTKIVLRTNPGIETKRSSKLISDDGVHTDKLDMEIMGKSASGSKEIVPPVTSFLREKVFLGIDPTPEVISIMAIYFVEGALGLARLAQTFYLKDELHLGPAELSALTGLFTLPWTIKPIYGFLSDGLPLFGYRRRSYLIICGVLGALCYLGLGTNFGGYFEHGNDVQTPISLLQATIASLVVSSGCIAFSDVVADGIVVQRTRDSDDPKVAGGLQSLCWGSVSVIDCLIVMVL